MRTKQPAEPPRATFRRASLWVLGAGLLATGLAFGWAWREARAEEARRLAGLVENWRQEFETRVEKYEAALAMLADWIVTHETPTQTEWGNRMERLSPATAYPGLALLTYSPWLGTFTENGERWGTHIPAHWPAPEEWGEAELPVYYQEAQAPVRALPFGHSMAPEMKAIVLPDPSALNDLAYLFHHTGVVCSSRLMVPLEDGSGEWAAFRMFTTAYRRGLPRATRPDEAFLPPEELGDAPQRREAQLQRAAIGVLSATLCVEPLLASIFGGRHLEIDVDLYAGSIDETNRLTRLDRPAIPLDPGAGARVLEIPWYFKKWRIVAAPNELFRRKSQRAGIWMLGGAGVGVSCSLFGLLRVRERGQRQAELWGASLEAARDELRVAHQSRVRLELDLHDGVLQSLYASLLGIRRAERLLGPNPERAGRLLREVASEIDATMAEIRGHLTSQAPDGISPDTLPVLLAGLAQAYNRTGATRVECEIQPEALRRLGQEQATQLFHCLREALANAHKHGGATVVRIGIVPSGSGVEARAIDNGSGFNPRSAQGRGRGLGHMAQRAEICGATLQIHSQPGGPTEILFRTPNGDPAA